MMDGIPYRLETNFQFLKDLQFAISKIKSKSRKSEFTFIVSTK